MNIHIPKATIIGKWWKHNEHLYLNIFEKIHIVTRLFWNPLQQQNSFISFPQRGVPTYTTRGSQNFTKERIHSQQVLRKIWNHFSAYDFIFYSPTNELWEKIFSKTKYSSEDIFCLKSQSKTKNDDEEKQPLITYNLAKWRF